MTFSEYKAWFEGFTEAFDGKVPTKAQWKRIQERMAEVKVNEVIPTIIREVRPWWPRWYDYTVTPYWISTSSGTYEANSNDQVKSNTFTLTACAYDVGKQEAAEFIS